MREWQDLHDQLAEIAAVQRLERNDAAAPASVLHQAILTGFLGASACSRRPQLPRRPGRALRDRARHAACEAPAALDRRGESRRDPAPVRAHGGAGTALVDRVGRRAPRAPQLLGGAVGRRARHGDGARDRVVVRARAEQRSAGELRHHRPGARAAHVRRGGAGAGPVEPARGLPRTQRAPAPGSGGRRGEAAPPRPARLGRGAHRLLPRNASRPTWRARAPSSTGGDVDEHSHPHRLDVPAEVLLAGSLPPFAASDYPPTSRWTATHCR